MIAEFHQDVIETQLQRGMNLLSMAQVFISLQHSEVHIGVGMSCPTSLQIGLLGSHRTMTVLFQPLQAPLCNMYES